MNNLSIAYAGERLGFRLLMGVVLVTALQAETCFGQTLTEKLKAESVTQLTKDALQKGNAVRGAILFPQQTLACANCHSPGADDLLGPDLTRMAKDVTNEHLVESILDPSKSIRKGFETSTIVTTAGKTHSGRIVRRSDDSSEVVLRESSAERRLRTFNRRQIDDISLSKKSAMPDKLADQLKDRQQFLDLVRYMIELRDSATVASKPANRQDPGARDLAELNPKLSGRVLLNEFHCAACHQDDLVKTAVPTKLAPNLTWLAGRTNRAFIKKMILKPHATKPGTKMPSLLSDVPAAERDDVAEQLTHFIESNQYVTSDPQVPVEDGAVERGRTLFHSVGCVACHSPRDENNNELLAQDSVSLKSVNEKYLLKGLIEFLEDPHASRPSGRMPNMKLSRFEANDIASYLLMDASNSNATAVQPNPQLIAKGRTQFFALGCNQCHAQIKSLNETQEQQRFGQLASLSKLRPEMGCLSKIDGGWPKYDLNDSQLKRIRAALMSTKPITAEENIQVSLTTFRCVACHQRGQLGGVSDDRNRHFQTTNPNLGPQGRMPPDLTHVGAKLQPKWMRQVLVTGRSIRPYVKTRMPQHGADNIGHLIGLFQNTDQLADANMPEPRTDKERKSFRDAGLQMAGTGGLNCIACHTFQEKPAATMPAVDLTEMSERLKPDWFYRYMLNPQQFNRGTVMPSFWPGGRSLRKDVLDGKPDQQVAALWEWLSDGRQARTPRGLIRTPIALLATDEAVMLRRSWPGIGKRGIGVGYPRQVNLAYDAEQMRIAILWRGPFADPGGVWRSQGHGMAQPMSREQTKFLPGPEFDDANSPWAADDGRPPKHRFKGYVLDELRRPTFLYNFDGIPVEDYAVDVSESNGGAFVRRTITFKPAAARAGLMFRLQTADEVSETNGEFVFGRSSLSVKIIGAFSGQVVKTDGGSELRIPLDLKPVATPLVLEYRWK